MNFATPGKLPTFTVINIIIIRNPENELSSFIIIWPNLKVKRSWHWLVYKLCCLFYNDKIVKLTYTISYPEKIIFSTNLCFSVLADFRTTFYYIIIIIIIIPPLSHPPFHLSFSYPPSLLLSPLVFIILCPDAV